MRDSILALAFVVTITAQAKADTVFTGVPADEVFFFVDGGVSEGPPENMLGLPDTIHIDLDGGAATFGFGGAPAAFDYETEIPVGTTLIIAGFGQPDIPTAVSYGFGVPVDGDGNGFADNIAGDATLLDIVTFIRPMYFYSVPPGVDFISISGGDFEIDAVQLVPEPPSIMLAVMGLLCVVVVRRRHFSPTLPNRQPPQPA